MRYERESEVKGEEGYVSNLQAEGSLYLLDCVLDCVMDCAPLFWTV